MTTFEKMSLIFPVQNVPPYGECLVVPGKDFDPDAEALLDDEGYACIFTDINHEPVTLVPTIKRHRGKSPEKVVPVYEPKHEPEKTVYHAPNLSGMKGPLWTKEEEDRLIKRMAELQGSYKVKCNILVKEFQGRSDKALLQKFKKLTDQGRAQRGKIGRPRKEKESRVPTDKYIHVRDICPACHLPFDMCACDEEKKESLREETRKEKPARALPEKKVEPESAINELIHFESYCRNCRDRRSTEDSNTWKVCPICGEPLIIWNIED